MKTWEMIKELTESPSKRFTYNTATKGSYVTIEGRVVVWRGQDQEGQALGVNIGNENWKEVRKPVDFMTAVKSDKRIWFPDISGEEEYLPLDVFLGEIASNYYAREIVAIITDGEFYIEGQGEHK